MVTIVDRDSYALLSFLETSVDAFIDLGHLDRVCQSSSMEIAFGDGQDLRLGSKSAKSGRAKNPGVELHARFKLEIVQPECRALPGGVVARR